jgi:hypothetical protein
LQPNQKRDRTQPDAAPQPKFEPEPELMQREQIERFTALANAEPLVQIETTSSLHSFIGVPDKHLAEKPKFRCDHQSSVKNFEQQKSNMLTTTIFIPTEGLDEDDETAEKDAVLANDGGTHMDGDQAYNAGMRSLLNWQEASFDLDEYISKLSKVLDSAAEIKALEKIVEEDIDKNKNRLLKIREEIMAKLTEMQGKEVKKLTRDSETMILSKLLDGAQQHMRKNMHTERAWTVDSQNATEFLNQIEDAHRENKRIESSISDQERHLRELHETRIPGYELWCYQQVRDMLCKCRNTPTAQVIPCKVGRPVYDVDKQLFDKICGEFGEEESEELRRKLTDTMEVVETAAVIRSTCGSYSQPGDVIRYEIQKLCDGINRIASEAHLREFEIRRYLHFRYAMTGLQVDGLLLWMTTYFAYFPTNRQDTYTAFMDAAVRLWAQQIGDEVDNAICKGVFVPPQRLRESGVLHQAKSFLFGGTDPAQEEKDHAICVIIALEFEMSLSDVRKCVERNMSIHEIAKSELTYTETSISGLSDRERKKEQKRILKKKHMPKKSAGGSGGLSDKQKYETQLKKVGGQSIGKETGWRRGQVTKLCTALGREFSSIEDAINQAQRALKKDAKKDLKSDRASRAKRGIEGASKEREPAPKMKEQLEWAPKMASLGGMSRYNCKLTESPFQCDHLGCVPVRGLFKLNIGEHLCLQTNTYIQDTLKAIDSDISMVQLKRYAMEYYGLETAEIKAILLEARAEDILDDEDELDSVFDNAVSAYGKRTGIKFTKATVQNANTSTLFRIPNLEYDLLNVIKTIYAGHFHEHSFASISDMQDIRTLFNQNQYAGDEVEMVTSLVESIVVIACNPRHSASISGKPPASSRSVHIQASEQCRHAIDSLATTIGNLLQFVMRVPCYRQPHNVLHSRGSGRFVPMQISEDTACNLTPAILEAAGTKCNDSFVSFAIQKKSTILLQSLCEFGGRDTLILADLDASLRDIKDQVPMFRSVLDFYPRPCEAIHAIMNIPLPTADYSCARQVVQSDRFLWVVFGWFQRSDVLLQAEFLKTASKFVIDGCFSSSPFLFCSLSTINQLVAKLLPSQKDRSSLPVVISSSVLLVQRAKGSDKYYTQLFSGAEISRGLRGVVKKYGKGGTERTAHVQHLMEAGSFEPFYKYLATHSSLLHESQSTVFTPDVCRGLNGRTLAHFAAASSCTDFRALFLRSPPNTCDANGFTPLHIAAKFGRLQHIHAILDRDGAVEVADMRTPAGLSALHLAAKFGHTGCVQRLLAMHENVHIDSLITSSGRTALQLAVLTLPEIEQTGERDWKNTVDVLMCAGADPLHLNPNGESALSFALMCTGVSTTRLAKHLDAMTVDKPDAARILSIHGLVKDCTEVDNAGDLEASTSYQRLQDMLNLGADPNAPIPPDVNITERTPLHYARSAVVAKLLRDFGANVHRKCGPTLETPLHAVVSSTVISEEQKAETCRVLLDGFAEYKNGALNSSHKSPLDVASDLGLMQLVRLFTEEEDRRILNYEQMQMDLERKSEINLSPVDSILAANDSTKRADMSERIQILVEQIKSKIDDEDATGRRPKNVVRNDSYHLSPSGGFDFDATTYEVFLTSKAADRLFSVDQATAHLILTALFELATTNNSAKIVSDEMMPQNFNVFTAQVVKNTWIIGERAAVYSTRVHKFTDCIRIWEICRDDSLVTPSKESLLSSLQNGSISSLSTYIDPVSQASGGPTLYETTKEVRPHRHVPLAEPGQSQSIMKLHQLSTFMTKSVMAPDACNISAREHPFHPAMKEAKIMSRVQTQRSSCLLLGRSGTGKTTLLSNHLFSQYCLSCPKQMPGKQPAPPFNQIFVTRNTVLVNCVRKSFRDMCQGSPTLTPLVELDGDGNDTDFPRFFDRQKFLEFIDSHLQISYFEDDQTWNRTEGDIQSIELHLATQRLRVHRKQQQDLIDAGCRDQEKQAQAEKALERIEEKLHDMGSFMTGGTAASSSKMGRSLRNSSRGKCVDYDFFSTHMWGRLETGRKISPSAVWTEIVSHITGSTEALQSGGTLSEEQYLNLSMKVSSTFRPDAENSDALSRKNVFAIFTRYQMLKKKLGCWDEADLVSHIYKQLSKDGWKGPPIHSLSADEIQDFTQAECWIMVNLCSDGNSLFLCGDTAQTISRVGFRFQDLKNIFHDRQQAECKRGLANEKQTQIPEVLQLEINFRSHDGILRPANAVVSTIVRLFPNAIDQLSEERGAFDGEQIFLIPDLKMFMLSKFVKQSSGIGHNLPIGFGANRVVLVRTAVAKERLPIEFRECLVLTVTESKGLEFNEVIIFNFFEESTADFSDWVAVLETQELDLSESRLGHKGHGTLSQRTTDPAEIMQLCEELKLFYVALTRARRRVIIFDQSESTRIPMFELLEKRKLARVASLQDIVPTEMGSDEALAMHSAECIEKGLELFKIGVFEEAKKCFRNGGEQIWEFKATAHIKEREAAQLRRELDTRQASGQQLSKDDQKAERKHNELLLDAGYCFVAASEEVAAHRCLLGAGDTGAAYAERIISAHTCMICLEDEGCDTYTACEHAFHRQCLRNWTNTGQTTCPYCRGKLELEMLS